MTYYGFGHGVGMSQCGAVGYAAERNMGYKAILRHYYKGASITSQGSSGGLFGWLRSLVGWHTAPRGHGTRPERPSGVTLAAKKNLQNSGKGFSSAAQFGILSQGRKVSVIQNNASA